MHFINSADHLKILILLSDQIWYDLENGIIDRKEYCRRIKIVNNEIDSQLLLTFSEIVKIAAKAGYLLIQHKNVFGKITKYNIAKN